MARKKVERNISYDDVRQKYYVNLDFGIDPETGKQVKKTQTFEKITQARAALRKHEAARDAGQMVLPKELTVEQWLNTWMSDVIKLSRAETTVYSYQKMIDNHETEKPLASLIDPEYKDQKAVKIAIAKLEDGRFQMHRPKEEDAKAIEE